VLHPEGRERQQRETREITTALVCVGYGRLMLLSCMRLYRVSYSKTTGAPKARHRAKYNADLRLKVHALGSITRPLFCVRSGGTSPSKKGESATARGDSVGSVRSPDAADKYPESIHVVDPSGVEKGGSGPVSSSSSKWLGSDELSFTVDKSFFPDYKPDAYSCRRKAEILAALGFCIIVWLRSFSRAAVTDRTFNVLMTFWTVIYCVFGCNRCKSTQ
jgi:hypothetical protein